MAGYIGKVAAVLSVNTSDVPGKIQSGFVAPMDRALRQVENTLRNTNRSITKSFDDIYTQGQKVARARALAAAGAVKGFDDVDFGKRLRIRDDIAEPVKRLATAIEKTAGSVRGQFEPAIVAVQAAAQSLFDRMATDAASVTQGEIAQMISRVESLAAAFDYANTASARMADGWANMNRAGAAAAEGRRRDSMFSGLGSAGRDSLRDLQRMRDFEAMVGQSSPINWQTPWRRGLAAPAGATNTGMGVNASSSIAGQGARTTLPPGYLERVVAERLQAPRRDAGQAFLASFGGRGVGGINLGLDQSSLQASAAQLRILQQAIGRAAAEARGPAVAAFERLRVATATAFDEGRIDAEDTRQELAALRQEAVNAAADASGASRRRLGNDVRRAGDVSRGGVDRIGLALQQGAFALDDFMSATGGLDMKIRAVQNNLTQLAFIIGSTTGLFIGLGVAIAAQATVGLMKWINNGRTSEDQTKALNDALEKQRTLVGELADSFQSLADSIAQSAMSAEDFSGRQLDRQLEGIAKKQKEAREESLFAVNPGVNAARASRNVAERRIREATDEYQMLAAQNLLARAARDEETAKSRVRARASAGVTSSEVMDALSASFQAEAMQAVIRERMASGTGGDDVTTAADVAYVSASAARIAEDWLDRNINAIQGSNLGALRAREAELLAGGGGDPALLGLRRSIATLELPLSEAADSVGVSVSRASAEAASKIKEAQDRVAEAVAAGTPGAAMFSVSLADTAAALGRAQDKIVSAAEASDPAQRRRITDEAKAAVDAISKTVDQQLGAARGLLFSGLGVKGGKAGDISAIRRVEGAGSVLSALEGSDIFGAGQPQMAATLRSLIAKDQEARADLTRSMTFGGGRDRVAAATAVEQAQEQLSAFVAPIQEALQTANTTGRQASRQAAKELKTQAEMMERGADLIASPNQRAVAAFRKDLEAAALAAAGPNRQTMMSQFFANRAAEVAPLLSQFAQERSAAAMAQYTPALQSADVSTMEGQRELNRLLRGEDSGKDVSLDELKKQTDLLGQMVEIAQREQNVVVDF